jgi:hypothetical protein
MIFFLFLLLAGGVFVAWKLFCGESDQDVIARRLHEVTRTFGKAGNEGFLVQMEHAREITRYFDEICDVRFPKFHKEAKMTREHITQKTLMVRKMADSMALSVYDLEFFFSESDPSRCRVLFTGLVNADFRTGERFREAYELETFWVKKNEEWLIEAVGFSGILQR